jgi:hypothetical protein
VKNNKIGCDVMFYATRKCSKTSQILILGGYSMVFDKYGIYFTSETGFV